MHCARSAVQSGALRQRGSVPVLLALCVGDQSRKLARAARQGLGGTREADGVGNAPRGGRVRRLAVLVQHADELRALDALEKLPRRHAAALVESQIERPVGLGPEATVRLVELR